MAIDKNEFWGDNYYNNLSLTDTMVLVAEKMLQVKLPPLFIELLKIQNGGYTKGFAFPMNTTTTWAENHVPLSELFGIVTDKARESAHNILETQYLIEEWGLPEKQVLINGDGHWWITLDYRQSDIPSVRWIDTECDEDIHIANSFEDFINGLVSEENYAD
ncbi:MAG: SMI1/KNR4 family protein [Bacteroidetes bacterium]|nr:SMI1/KNR4 family protein [Bacteroidota bacterium]